MKPRVGSRSGPASNKPRDQSQDRSQNTPHEKRRSKSRTDVINLQKTRTILTVPFKCKNKCPSSKMLSWRLYCLLPLGSEVGGSLRGIYRVHSYDVLTWWGRTPSTWGGFWDFLIEASSSGGTRDTRLERALRFRVWGLRRRVDSWRSSWCRRCCCSRTYKV